MNTHPGDTANEIEPNVPNNITRRTFIERTSGTVLATVLALHAFRAEAAAITGSSSSGHWEIFMTGTPPATESTALGSTTLLITPHPVVDPLDPRITPSVIIPATQTITYPSGISYSVAWGVPAFNCTTTIQASCLPSLFTKTVCSDGEKRYLYSEEGINFVATFSIGGLWSDSRSCGGAFQANLIKGGPAIDITGNPVPPDINVNFVDGSFIIPVVFTVTDAVLGLPNTFTGSLSIAVRATVMVSRSGSSLTGRTLLDLTGFTFTPGVSVGPNGPIVDRPVPNGITNIVREMLQSLQLPTVIANPPSTVTVSFSYDTFWSVPQ